MKTNLRMLWTGLFLSASAAAHAGDVVGLKSFTSGTPALASEVNGNFTAAKSAVDDNASRVTTLEGVNAAGRLTVLEGLNADSRLTALETQFAAQVKCPANAPDRFTDNGDGTVCDRDTGLMWESQKLASDDVPGNCAGVGGNVSRDFRCVNRTFTWPDFGAGSVAWVDFLAKMNGELGVSADGVTSTPTPTAYAGYRDWRVPSVDEMQSIISLPGGFCLSCIDPVFGPWRGNILSFTSSSDANDPALSWVVHADATNAAFAETVTKSLFFSATVRAVRNGR